MKRIAIILIGVIIMCTALIGSNAAGATSERLILGVRVGEEEIDRFQGGDNMLMSGAFGAETEQVEIVVHAKANVLVNIDGVSILPETAKEQKLNPGFNIFTLTASDGEKEETVYLNVERLPEGLYSELTRPVYHFTPYRYQMNDPNGLVYDAQTGLYHLFFQCNRPFATGLDERTRTTGWGHAVSDNLITWTELPMALTPDRLGAAWSGSGVVDRNNTSGLFDDSVPPESRLMVFYASVYGDETYGMAKISMAYSKDGGVTWIRYDGNPVVKNTANRYGMGLRDPKVIWYENEALEGGGCWIMVTCGNTYLFTSNDLINWKVSGGIVRDVSGKTVECECPDLFCLPFNGDENNKKWILTLGGVSYLIGDLAVTDRGNVKYLPETDPIMNLNGIADQIPGIKAPEIYATQTFYTDPLGRRVSMSWIRDPYHNWRDKIWNSAQSIPLVNTLRTVGGQMKLFRYPVDEISFIRSMLLYSASGIDLGPGSSNPLSGINSDCFDIEAVITPGTADNIEFGLRAAGDSAELMIRYCVSEKKLYITKGGEVWNGVYDPEVHLSDDGKLYLRLMMDKICYDIFGNGGEAAVQGILYTLTNADGLYLKADGNAQIDSLKVWSMSVPEGGIDVRYDTDSGTVLNNTEAKDNNGSDYSPADSTQNRESGRKSGGLTPAGAVMIGAGAFAGTLALAFAAVKLASKKKK